MNIDVNIEGEFVLNGHKIRIGILADTATEALEAMYKAADILGASAVASGEQEEESPPTAPTAVPAAGAPAPAAPPRRRGRRSNAEIIAAHAASVGATPVPAPAPVPAPPNIAPLVSMTPAPPSAPQIKIEAGKLAPPPPAPPPQQYTPPNVPAGPQPYANPNGMYAAPPVIIDRNPNWQAWVTAIRGQISIIKQTHGPGAEQALNNILSAHAEGNIDNMTETQMSQIWDTFKQAFPPQSGPRHFG